MDPVLWRCIVALDVGGLLLGALLLFVLRARRRLFMRASPVAMRASPGAMRALPGAMRASPAVELVLLGGLGLALALCGLALGIGLFGDGFAVLRLWCHAIFCVLAPLCMARGLQRRGHFGWSLLALGACAEGVYLFARHVEPFRLQVRRESVECARLPARDRPLRIAVLADLQAEALGAYEERVFAALDAARADLVLVPGDLLQFDAAVHPWQAEEQRAERAALAALFRGLRHRPYLGIVMVGGDTERPGVGLEEGGVRLLENDSLVFRDEGLQVIGLTNRASREPLDRSLVDSARAFPGLTVVLGHAPDFALSAKELDLELLCIAGHTHGGQVALPFFGPLLTLSRVPRAIAAGGLHRLGRSWLCVSRGVGMERGRAPRIRFLCPPELVVLELGSPPTPALFGRISGQ